MIRETPDGMVCEAIWHIACVVYNHSEPKEGEEGLDEEELIHLMSAIYGLAHSYLRERRIC